VLEETSIASDTVIIDYRTSLTTRNKIINSLTVDDLKSIKVHIGYLFIEEIDQRLLWNSEKSSEDRYMQQRFDVFSNIEKILTITLSIPEDQTSTIRRN
jgi:hypothetical protein